MRLLRSEEGLRHDLEVWDTEATPWLWSSWLHVKFRGGLRQRSDLPGSSWNDVLHTILVARRCPPRKRPQCHTPMTIHGITTSLTGGVSSSLFVDDWALWFSAYWMSSRKQQQQQAIDRTSRWAEEHNFHFSFSPLVAMHFCRLRSNPNSYCAAPVCQ